MQPAFTWQAELTGCIVRGNVVDYSFDPGSHASRLPIDPAGYS
jgi:hypothetical protein